MSPERGKRDKLTDVDWLVLGESLTRAHSIVTHSIDIIQRLSLQEGCDMGKLPTMLFDVASRRRTSTSPSSESQSESLRVDVSENKNEPFVR